MADDDFPWDLYSRKEFALAEGITLVNTHPEILCQGRGCSLHHPSEHHMRNWPKDFRTRETHPGDWGFFDRFCRHRKGHPDPDDVRYWREERGRDITAHECCVTKCCQPFGEDY